MTEDRKPDKIKATPARQDAAHRPLVAVDDGFAQMKIAYGDPSLTTPPTLDHLRSSACFGAISDLSGGAVSAYETDNGRTVMTVSDQVVGETTEFDGFHTSSLNRILMAHSLVHAGLGGQDVDLWAALPVTDFYTARSELNRELIDQKIGNLKIPVLPRNPDEHCARYHSINIGCQAVSAIIDYAVDDDLTQRDVCMDRVAVVDIGGRTTDIAYVINGGQFIAERSGTQNIGVLEVHSRLATLICEKYRLSANKFSSSVLDAAMRSGKIKVFGKEAEIVDLIEKAVSEPASRLATMIRQKIGDGAELDTILFVGGGAKLFKAAAETFVNAHIPENPEFSNVRGLYKYAKSRAT